MTTTPAITFAEGWYPTRAGFVRYWDGDEWDDQEFPLTPGIQRLMQDAAESGRKENNAGIFGFLTVLVTIGVTILEPLAIAVDPLLGLLAVGFGIAALVRRKTRKRSAIWPAIVAISAGGIIALISTVSLVIAAVLFARQ